MKKIIAMTMGFAILGIVGCSSINNDLTESTIQKKDTSKSIAVKSTEKPKVKEKAKVPETSKNPCIIIETSMGTIKAELWPDKAPKTVANFLKYTEDKFFDNTIFHRVIRDFMIQGGGMNTNMRKKDTRSPVKNEARSDCRNDRGTLAMARTSVVDSATAQFFINLKNNAFLNHRGKSSRDFGYCVFGKVLSGMDIVDKIGITKTRPGDIPVATVLIKSIRLEK